MTEYFVVALKTIELPPPTQTSTEIVASVQPEDLDSSIAQSGIHRDLELVFCTGIFLTA
jgi:hypothetical protein